MWESEEFPRLFALAIPHHGKRDIPIGTANNILDQLELDLIAWEERVNREEEAERRKEAVRQQAKKAQNGELGGKKGNGTDERKTD